MGLSGFDFPLNILWTNPLNFPVTCSTAFRNPSRTLHQNDGVWGPKCVVDMEIVHMDMGGIDDILGYFMGYLLEYEFSCGWQWDI